MPEALASAPDAGCTVLGFDFGTRRIGVAIGNGVTGGARPLRVLDGGGGRHWEAIAELLREWQPGRLVVGVPRHPDGNAHDMTTRCERFARQLEGRFHLPVERVDERYSSAVLEGAGRGAARDDESAALLVQQWFDEHAVSRSSP
jgi:putative Holliday junction resolvase